MPKWPGAGQYRSVGAQTFSISAVRISIQRVVRELSDEAGAKREYELVFSCPLA